MQQEQIRHQWVSVALVRHAGNGKQHMRAEAPDANQLASEKSAQAQEHHGGGWILNNDFRL